MNIKLQGGAEAARLAHNQKVGGAIPSPVPILAALLVLLSGCASITYTKTNPDGTRVTAGAISVFSGTAIKGFNSDSKTEKTSTGLKFSSSETNPELEALGTLIGAAVKAAK